jgi:hypothetical protein
LLLTFLNFLNNHFLINICTTNLKQT